MTIRQGTAQPSTAHQLFAQTLVHIFIHLLRHVLIITGDVVIVIFSVSLSLCNAQKYVNVADYSEYPSECECLMNQCPGNHNSKLTFLHKMETNVKNSL